MDAFVGTTFSLYLLFVTWSDTTFVKQHRIQQECLSQFPYFWKFPSALFIVEHQGFAPFPSVVHAVYVFPPYLNGKIHNSPLVVRQAKGCV